MPQDNPYVTLRKGDRVADFPRENLVKAKALGWMEVKGTDDKPVQPSLLDTFGMETARGMGLDPEKIRRLGGGSLGKQSLEASRQVMKSTGEWLDKVITDTAHDPIKGISHVADPFESLASGVESGVGGVWDVLTTGNRKDPDFIRKLVGASGRLTGAVSNVAAGVEAPEAAKLPGKVVQGAKQLPSKVHNVVPAAQMSVENFMHTGGLAAKTHIQNAVTAARKQVSAIADGVSKTVDTSHPEGAIDAVRITKDIRDDLKQIVKLPEPKVPTALSKITEGRKGATSTGPRIMGQFLDLSRPSDLAFFQKIKGSLSPQEIARMEGQVPQERWSFEQAKQMRTELGRSIGSTQGPMKAVAKLAYKRLTDSLSEAAAGSNRIREWEYYNKLHKNLEDRLEGNLGSILNSETGREVADKLTKDPAFTRELMRDLKKYGLDTEAIGVFAKYANKAKSYLDRGIIRQWPAAIFGGYLGKALGVPWAEAAIAGGYGAPLYRLMKAAKEAEASQFGKPGEQLIENRALPAPMP